jgi:hypothetical protein
VNRQANNVGAKLAFAFTDRYPERCLFRSPVPFTAPTVSDYLRQWPMPVPKVAES